jgi:hypothetical protein
MCLLQVFPEPNLSEMPVNCPDGSTCNKSNNVFGKDGLNSVAAERKMGLSQPNLHPGTVVMVRQ